MNEVAPPLPSVRNVDPQKALELVQEGALLIDVRTPAEVAEGTLPGALVVNAHDVEAIMLRGALGEHFGSDLSRPLVLFCRSGNRSGSVAELLRNQGYQALYNGGGYKDLVDTFVNGG
jgi:phage shock protein E